MSRQKQFLWDKGSQGVFGCPIVLDDRFSLLWQIPHHGQDDFARDRGIPSVLLDRYLLMRGVPIVLYDRHSRMRGIPSALNDGYLRMWGFPLLLMTVIHAV